MRSFLFLVLLLPTAWADVRTLTRQEALALALKDSPDLVLARYDQIRAQEAARVARDPFFYRVYAGSGAAWTTGYPLSIEGSAPTIFRTQILKTIYNRPLKFQVLAAQENVRGAGIDQETRRDDVVYRTALLYADAQRAEASLAAAKRQLASAEDVAGTVRLRVAEGRELDIENKRAALTIARARQRVQALEADRDFVEASLAAVLGLTPDDRVRPAEETHPRIDAPATEETAVDSALSGSKEIRRLQSALMAKQLEIRGLQSSRYPIVELAAQYGLLARYVYQDFFGKFQRNSAQLGASFQVPILGGAGSGAREAQARAEAGKLQAQIAQMRNQIALDTRRSYQEQQRAETAAEVARLELELAREQLTILLAQLDEGRSTQRQVEEARTAENERWIAYYEARHQVERARLALLRQTGTIMALVQ